MSYVMTKSCWSVLLLQVAIKSIKKEKIKDEQDMVHIRREIEIMSSLRHPHIISIYEGLSFSSSFLSFFFLVQTL